MWWRRPEPALDRGTVDGIIRLLMKIDAGVERIIERLDIDDEEEEEEADA